MVEEEKKTDIKENHLHVNHLNVDTKNSMISRIVVAVLLVVLCVPCIVLGDYVFLGLILLASIVSTHEIVKTPQSLDHKFNNILYVFAYIMMFMLIYWIFVKNNLASYIANPETYQFSLYNNFETPTISLSAFVTCIGFLFLMIFFDKKFTMQDFFYFIGMLFIVSVGYQSIMFLRFYPFTEIQNDIETLTKSSVAINSEEIEILKTRLAAPEFKYFQSIGLLFYMLIGVCMNDVGAYFVGVLFGKHKFCPDISPKKTWEGFFGGVFFSIAFSLTFALLMAYFDFPILRILDLDCWYNVLALSVLMPIVGTFGDLLFSSIKRFYKIKDFGQALRSHGGVLDRLDSILISSIALGLFIPLMEHSWAVWL